MTDVTDLAERLIGDIDALDAERNLAAYECDARLVAREYVALSARLAQAEQEEALKGEWPHSHADSPRLNDEAAIEPDELSEWIIRAVFVRCETCRGGGGECECGGTGFDWTDTAGVRALLTRLLDAAEAREQAADEAQREIWKQRCPFLLERAESAEARLRVTDVLLREYEEALRELDRYTLTPTLMNKVVDDALAAGGREA